MNTTFFSEPQETIEQAQALYEYDLFNPAAIFRSPDGFMLGYVREQNWMPHETALKIKALTGFEMVSCCDPILGIWKPYKPEAQPT